LQIRLKVYSRKVHHLGRLQPYPQTLDKAGKAGQGQTLYLINILAYWNQLQVAKKKML
jgi:hypothetical protein